MEKRLFLAIAASFLTLYVWTLFTPKTEVKSTQVFENKDVIEYQNISEENNIEPTEKEKNFITTPSLVSSIEEVVSLESENLKVDFSDVGGVIKGLEITAFNEKLPIKNLLAIKGFEKKTFSLNSKLDNKVVYVYKGDDLQITKKYFTSDSGYVIDSEIVIQNLTNMSKLIDLQIKGFDIDMSNLDVKEAGNAREKGLLEYSFLSEGKVKRKGNAYKFSEKERKIEQKEIDWIAFRNRYFCAIVKPEYKVFGLDFLPQGDKIMSLSVDSKGIDIPAGSEVSFKSKIYYGPQDSQILKEEGFDFDKVVSYSGFGLFNVIAILIHHLIIFLHKIFPNWGVCVLLTSVVVYFSMYPLTLKGMSSMKRMQSLQPKIAELKKKHEKNPQKMNKEMMELYKVHKINPIGGCLPFLFQMPVFIGLYQVLWRSVEFKGATFLWINDLSLPDRLFILPKSFPIIGNEINILPLFMMVIMFFQQKFSAKNMTMTEPAQIAQQKMMATVFPLFLGFIFYKFASGLTLYFTMFYIFSTITQYKMSKQPQVVL